MEIINCYSEKLRKEREAKEVAERKERQHEYEVKFNLIFSSVTIVLAVPFAIIIVGIAWLSSGQPLYQEWIYLKWISAAVAEIVSVIYLINSIIRYNKYKRIKFLEKFLNLGRK